LRYDDENYEDVRLSHLKTEAHVRDPGMQEKGKNRLEPPEKCRFVDFLILGFLTSRVIR
jgi:hypothetical protein